MNRRAWLTAVVAAPLVALVAPMLPKGIEFLVLPKPRWRWVSTGDNYVDGWRVGNGFWTPVEPTWPQYGDKAEPRIFADDPRWYFMRGQYPPLMVR